MTYIDPTTGTNFKIQDFFQACVTLTVGEHFWWGSLWFGLCICALMTRQSLWIKLCWTKCPCQIVHECKRIQNELFVMGVNSFTCLLYHFFTIYQRKNGCISVNLIFLTPSEYFTILCIFETSLWYFVKRVTSSSVTHFSEILS